jgi:hypothetical protein
MSEMPGKRQTGIKRDGGTQSGSAGTNSRAPGSRSRQAGGEFLKALASDLAAVASWLWLLLIRKRRRTPPARAPEPSGISWVRASGRALWHLTMALSGLGAICAVAAFAVVLWGLYGLPIEQPGSGADSPGLRLEAASGESAARSSELNASEVSRQDFGREPRAPARPEADETTPSIALPGSITSSDASPPAQCDRSACASAYRSFRDSDCTYQPFDGPRRLCEAGASSATADPKNVTKERPTEAGARPDQLQPVQIEMPDDRPAARQREISGGSTEISGSSAEADSRAPLRCHADLCAARYKSFNAADCTYQPYDGGPPRVCEQ